MTLQDIAYQIELAGKEGDMDKAVSFIPKLDEQLGVLKGLAFRKFLFFLDFRIYVNRERWLYVNFLIFSK